MSPEARRPARELSAEYDFSRAVRGKYYERYRQGAKFTVTDLETGSRTLVFKDAGVVDATKLGDVLFLFRGAYAAGLHALRRSSRKVSVNDATDIGKAMRSHIGRLDVKGIDSLFTKDLGDEALITRSLSYHSPLEMTLSGVSDALAAAVLLAGGDFQAAVESSDGGVPMPPVGEVIPFVESSLGSRCPSTSGIRNSIATHQALKRRTR